MEERERGGGGGGDGKGMERRGRGGVEVVEREGKNTIKSLSSGWRNLQSSSSSSLFSLLSPPNPSFSFLVFLFFSSSSTDPFGHSATSAMLDVAIGFEGLFYARMDYQDLANR